MIPPWGAPPPPGLRRTLSDHLAPNARRHHPALPIHNSTCTLALAQRPICNSNNKSVTRTTSWRARGQSASLAYSRKENASLSTTPRGKNSGAAIPTRQLNGQALAYRYVRHLRHRIPKPKNRASVRPPRKTRMANAEPQFGHGQV